MTNFLYNPDRKNRKQLITEFVVRTEILDDILFDIKTSDMASPEQHYLLVGQRGTGKTTLLLRIKYAIEDDQKLNKWLIPVIFNEEQYNITELANLWEQIAQFLEDYHDFSGLHEQMELYSNRKNFEEICYDILEEALKERDKKLVLLIDNIGDLLRKLGENEVRRLREILQTKKYLRLIAGSPFYLDSILDYSYPLFEFFKVQRLDGLNKEEAEKLLLKLGEVHGEKEKIQQIIEETPERIETLRILTGGVPRTLGLMFQIFIDHEHESSLKDLERILDAVTPLYKHRMDDLPTQQQKIVDAVAKNWDAISVKDLKTKVRLESKVISAQLRQLEKNQIIEKRITDTKNHLYLLKERFWNIWYLMRYGRKTDSERVIWLVRFLESWCSASDFEKRIISYIDQLSNGKINEEAAAVFAEVYAAIKGMTPSLKYKLKQNVPERVAKKITLKDGEIAEIFQKYWNENNYIDALTLMIAEDRLSYHNKSILDKKLSQIEFKELGKVAHETLDKYTGNSGVTPGMILLYLHGQNRLLVKLLSRKKIEEVPERLDEIISTLLGITFDLDYEYLMIYRTIIYLLLFNKLSMVHSLFDKLKKFDLIDRLKPAYYSLLFFSDGPNSESLKIFGDETKRASEKLIDTVLKFWEKYDPLS